MKIIMDFRKSRADSLAPNSRSLYEEGPFLHLSGDHSINRHVVVQKHRGSSGEGTAVPAHQSEASGEHLSLLHQEHTLVLHFDVVCSPTEEECTRLRG